MRTETGVTLYKLREVKKTGQVPFLFGSNLQLSNKISLKVDIFIIGYIDNYKNRTRPSFFIFY